MSTLVALLLALIAAATGVDRAVDPALTAIAERRVVEVQADFSHTGWDPCCAEVIAWNSGHADPAAKVVEEWQGSPPHWAILTDPALASIGCAVAQVDVRTFAVCILAGGLQPAAPPPAHDPAHAPARDLGSEPAVAVLPDSAMAAP